MLACGNGVFWANIPTPGGSYVFKRVAALSGTFSGATPGPDGSVLVSAWGDGATHFGVYFGDWSSGDLVFQKMNVPGDTNMFWTTLASCDANLNRCYCAASDTKGKLISVLRHDHANHNMSWELCSSNVADAPTGKDLFNSSGEADNGGWIKTLRVSPTNPDVVTLNWALSFISSSAGRDAWVAMELVPGDSNQWKRSDEWQKHMHEDGHATVFDADDEKTLYMVSDGGVGATSDLGKTFVSRLNQHLPTLTFDSLPQRENPGAFTAGPWPTGLVAGCLQDNGAVYCQLAPGPTPWRFLRTGDGLGSQFVRVDQRLIWYVNDDEGVKVSRFDGTQFVDTAVIPRADEFPAQKGLLNPVMEASRKAHISRLLDRSAFGSGRLRTEIGGDLWIVRRR